MNRCLDIQWGMHMAERDKVCVHVCVGWPQQNSEGKQTVKASKAPVWDQQWRSGTLTCVSHR